VIDNVKERLALAKKIGATPVVFSKGDAVEQIFALRKPHRESVQNLQPGAGDKMPGVMCTIDAIGYEAKKHDTATPITPPCKIPNNCSPTWSASRTRRDTSV